MTVCPNLYVILCCMILLPRIPENMKHPKNRVEDQLSLYLFFFFSNFASHYLHQQNQPHAHVLIKTDMA